MANLLVMKDGSEVVRYDNPQIPVYVMKGKLSQLSDMRAFCHWHDDVELTFALSGHMMYEVNGRKVALAEGDGIFITPHQMHYGYSADGTDCEYVCVVFRANLLSWNKTLWEKYIIPIEQSGRFTFIPLSATQESGVKILSLMKELYRIRKRNDVACELDEIAVLHRLWAELYRTLQQELTASFSDDRNVSSFKNMLGYLYKNFATKITLEEIAAAGNVGRSTCCAMFTKYTGRSPVDYLNAYRIEVGVNMLNTTKQSVTDIAFACGFTSSSYFAEEFQKGERLHAG